MQKETNDVLDFNLYYSTNPNENEITGLHLFMQEIELMVKLNEKVWGNSFYVDLEKYVYNKYISLEHIRQEIVGFVARNCSQSAFFTYKIEVQLMQLDESKDMLYISFTIFDDVSDRSFVQKFSIG